MRISTSTLYDAGIATMQRQTQQLLQTQQQIASGRRILTPADDPVAAARALDVSQALSINAQYSANSAAAGESLALEESVLGSISGLLQDVRDAVVSAGNATLNRNDRVGMATELRGRYQDLLGLANSTDGSGQYLFSGYQGGIRPFGVAASGKVVYAGDQGQRLVQVSASRQIAVSDAGTDVFERIATGNGSFATQAAAGNSGTAVIDAGTVLDASKWNDPANSKNLSLKFAVVAGVTTYDIIDESANGGLGASLLAAPRSYASGSSIELGADGPPAVDFGAQVRVVGAPADGDSFTIGKSVSQNVFQTVSDLADLLQTSAGGTALTNGLAAVQRNLDNALENVRTARTSAGARMKELDAVQSAGGDRALQYSETLARLQEVDYAKAASELTQQQVNLEAAQKSFVKVAGLSLFNYL